LSLIASGIASSVVDTISGQLVMQGFVGFAIPIWVCRLLTMIPSFVVVAWGVDATRALVLSQVALSLALPVPMLALLWFTCRRDIMGVYRNRPIITGLALVASAVVLSLNIFILLPLLGVNLPGLSG
jgi:manganese transport protein